MLQDAPSEVTCISYWPSAYSKITNASDGTSCTPKASSASMPRSRDFLQRPSATSQGIGVTLDISVYSKNFIKIQIVTGMTTI